MNLYLVTCTNPCTPSSSVTYIFVSYKKLSVDIAMYDYVYIFLFSLFFFFFFLKAAALRQL